MAGIGKNVRRKNREKKRGGSHLLELLLCRRITGRFFGNDTRRFLVVVPFSCTVISKKQQWRIIRERGPKQASYSHDSAGFFEK